MPFVFRDPAEFVTPVGQAINAEFLGDEERLVTKLAAAARFSDPDTAAVIDTASRLVEAVRRAPASKSGLDAFLRQYDLSSQEGVILMCLAEALLRIPDDETADRLIADKLRAGDWASHLGDSQSLFVNASTWGLMLTGRLVRLDADDLSLAEERRGARRQPDRRAGRAHRDAPGHAHHGSPVRDGAHINEALDNSLSGQQPRVSLHVRHARRSRADGRRCRSLLRVVSRGDRRAARPRRASTRTPKRGRAFRSSCRRCIRATSAHSAAACCTELGAAPGRAVRRRARGRHRADARRGGVGAARAVARVARGRVPRCRGSPAGTASASPCRPTRSVRRPCSRWLANLARRDASASSTCASSRARTGTARSSARQERGLPGYPVFTRKTNTDVSYLACARQMLEQAERAVPAVRDSQRAHGRRDLAPGAPTSACVRVPAPARHGRGALCRGHPRRRARRALSRLRAGRRARGPVAVPRAPSARERRQHVVRESHRQRERADRQHRRRSGADRRRLRDQGAPAHSAARATSTRRSAATRRASTSRTARCCSELAARMDTVSRREWVAGRRWSVAGSWQGRPTPIRNPAEPRRRRRHRRRGDAATGRPGDRRGVHGPARLGRHAGRRARGDARAGRRSLRGQPARAASRCACARPARPSPTASPRFARRSISCATTRRARAPSSATALRLPGPTGESNELTLHGRGVFACISPWNFPLAIFTGQVAAALAAGNTVLAKPAEQTPLVAAQGVRLLQQAGVPADVLQFLPGDGAIVGARARRRSARRRRRVHRVDRDGAPHSPQPRGARRADPDADRRDRRPERA